jgi:transcription antitermination factor NusG
MSGDNDQRNWYAVRVRPNLEKSVCDFLQTKGLEAFLPTYQEPRNWSDRVKILNLPLFPGYLFCRTNDDRRLPILTTPGVRDIVGFGKTPAPIPEFEIDAVRRFIHCDLKVKPWPFLRIGQKVTIQKGPLSGIEGILQEFKGGCRVVVSISLLQRSIAAELDGTWVRSDSGSSDYFPHASYTNSVVC